jgi:type IV secretion system protein VirB1
MDASSFLALAAACAPAVHADTAKALVEVESGFNPWALAVVGGELAHQPRTRTEAIVTARALQAQGIDFSVGLGQINARNFRRLGLAIESAFEPCANLAAMQTVLSDCFERAQASGAGSSQTALRQAVSCYYSGNFHTGFRHGYVSKVVVAARRVVSPSTTSMKE